MSAQNLMNAILSEANKRIRTKSISIVREMKTACLQFFHASNTYQELTQGSLRGHFGFETGSEYNRVDTILAVFIDSIGFNFTPYKWSPSGITGKFELTCMDSSYADLLSLPEAVVVNFSKKYQNGLDLNWLDWLLTKGVSIPTTADGPINSHILFSDHALGENSRSRIALMIPGGTWHVPAIAAGTNRDNWITRTVWQADFERVMNDIIYKYIS